MQCTTYHGVEFAAEGRESSRVPATCSVQHTMELSSLVKEERAVECLLHAVYNIPWR